MKRYILLVFLLILGLGTTAMAQDCQSVGRPKQMNEVVTFYAYSYHTNRYNQELRLSNVFKISYNFDPRSGVDHTKIALRMSQDFMFFLKDMRLDGTHTPNELATSTQQKGTFICVNKEAVDEHRIQMIEEYEQYEKAIIEETSYDFEYKFNQFYKATTKVSVTKF